MFDNGFRVSVISHGYGGEDGLLELAVVTKDGLHYNNSVARGDVRGRLTQEEVDELIEEVKSFDKYDPTDKDKHYGN